MKNKTFLYTLIFIHICLLSCNNEHLEQFNFNKYIKGKLKSVKKIDSLYHISICDDLPFKWEKIIILRPYGNTEYLEKRKFKNDGELVSKFSYVPEAMCILVFVEKDKIIRYSYVPRITLDFNLLTGYKKSDDEISKQQACKKLYAKRNKTNSFLIKLIKD